MDKQLAEQMRGSLCTSIAVVMLVTGSVGPAVAQDTQNGTVEALETAGVLDQATGGGTLQVAGGEVDVAGQGVTIETQVVEGEAEVVSAGTTVFSNVLPATDGVVQEIAGGVRLMTVAKGPEAPTRVDYTFAGSVLTAQGDGSVLVEVDGQPVSTILPAWALDANGAPVPTRYEISGDTLTQVTEHQGAVYPVVSDPASVGFCMLNWLPAVCVKYTRAETVQSYNQLAIGAGAAVVGAALCGMLPWPGAPTACRALLAYRLYDFQDALRTAYNSGKCLDSRMTWPILPGAFIDYRAVNC